MNYARGAPRGKQTPRIEHAPAAASSAGQDVIDLAASAGLQLDPWQRHVLHAALGERLDGTWQSFEVCLIVPRQNGKGAVIEALELACLFLFDEDRLILHSAHEFKTAREAFLRIRGLIESTPQLAAKVRRFYASTGGECGIELHDGKRLRFLARSAGAGRGFSPDKLIMDEAFNLPDTFIDATLSSVGARPNAQVWYTSTAGDQDIGPCDVLTRIRERGIAGTDDRLTFMEWSVPVNDDGTVRGSTDDPKLWAIANPSLGIRKTVERMQDFHGSLSAAGFAREELGVGNYPQLVADVLDSPFGHGVWEALRLNAGTRPKMGTLGVAVSVDRLWCSLATIGQWDDGTWLLSAIERRSGTDGAVAEVARLFEKHGCAVVLDSKGPSADLTGPLRDLGVSVTALTTDEYISACATLYDAVQAGEVSHMGDDDLSNAVAVASIRNVGDRWAWGRRKSVGDISTLEAATLAWAGRDLSYDIGDSFL